VARGGKKGKGRFPMNFMWRIGGGGFETSPYDPIKPKQGESSGMALRIRLARYGAKKRPFYRIVVSNSEAPRDGRFLDIIGTYDPRQEPAAVSVKEDLLKEWVGKGATCTDTVASLLKRPRGAAAPEAWAQRQGWSPDSLTEVATMKELVKFIAQSLVDNPEQVQVNEIEGEQTSVIELKVAKEDLGKVIGKQGRTARAMRTILSAASTKIRKRAVLEILE
jgi:uncharacterized protein